MQIGGFQKTSFIDYPQKISAVIFTKSCNFTCPYCHNSSLLQDEEEFSIDYVMAILQERKYLLQGLVITGGEPTLQKDLSDFCSQIKKMGYAIKIDTNGSNPSIIQELISNRLIDYVAMDIKANPKQYPTEIMKKNHDSIVQTMNILNSSGIKHEYRIPCVYPFITQESFSEILNFPSTSPIFLQKVQIDEVLNKNFFMNDGYPLAHQNILDLQEVAHNNNRICSIR